MSEEQHDTKGPTVENEKWIRLAICLKCHVKKALVGILHNTINHGDIFGLPQDPSDLYNFMVANKKKISPAYLRLLTPNEKKVSSEKLDITLLRYLIQTFAKIKNEDRGWNEPRDEDHSIAAAVYRAAKIRNEVFHHGDPKSIDKDEFEAKWCKIEEILSDLQYEGDIVDLKNGPIDASSDVKYLHSNMAKDFEKIMLDYKERCNNENKDELKIFIERKFKDESTNNIITDLDQLLSSHNSVMVSGEAGLGKTFSAKHLRYLWSSDKILKERKLLYIDSKKVNKGMYKPSHAAPICVSELSSVLINKPEGYLESFGCVKKPIENLVIVIDGVDELHIEENKLNLKFLNELHVKIDKNEEISAMETIMGIYFGDFFPGSKIIAFGRKHEIDRLKGVKDLQEHSNIFNRQTRIVLELQPLDEDGVKGLISRATCKRISCSCEKCTNTYSSVQDVEFRNIPSHLMAIIKIFEDLPKLKIGRITKTKIFIITIFNLLKNHMQTVILKDLKTFKTLFSFDETQAFRECIQSIAAICFISLLVGNVAIEVEEYHEDGVKYLKFENTYNGRSICEKIELTILEQLDFFYVRDFGYHFVLEPYHLTSMEFLASCFIYCYPNNWDVLLLLNDDRQKIIIPYVAGLHSNDSLTKDFVSEILQDTSNLDIENYLSWLFSIEDISKLRGGIWYGLKENSQLFPSFEMLHRINEEVDAFDNISKKLKEVRTIICYCFFNFEWYEMKRLKHTFLTSNENRYNMKSFISNFKKYQIIIRDWVEITNSEQFSFLSELFQNEQLKFEINLRLNFVIGSSTHLTSQLKVETLTIGSKCDSHTIDFLLNACSIPTTTTQTYIQCKELRTDNISLFDDRQIKKLFEICLSDAVDSIALTETFFTDKQLQILKDTEQKDTNKLINIKLDNIKFEHMFDLLNRHISLDSIRNINDNDILGLRAHITPGYSYTLSNYKIVTHNKPFLRAQNYSRGCEQSMYLTLWNTSFSQVSPEVFADTFSLIPSLECADGNNESIQSSHWLSLSQTENCQINEMRIWWPKSENLEHFLNIKTNIIQFICMNKYSLKLLLNYIVNNPNVQSDEKIRVFVVKINHFDSDNYEEMTLFSRKTIKEYRNNFGSDNLLLEDICVPLYEGGDFITTWWCCEISQNGNDLCVKSSSDVNQSVVGKADDELNDLILIEDTKNEDNRTESQGNVNSSLLKKCCCCFSKL